MIETWSNNINRFIELSNKYKVRMIMVGGGAVNFHGYQRHSADVDFWIDTTESNLLNLIEVFNEMGYQIVEFPNSVRNQHQNISVKFSPTELILELITNFSTSKTFDEAYEKSVIAEIEGQKILKWRVISYDDLIDSKLKANRPKDLLDVQQLQKINRKKK
ncbi:MAG TPA: hypothetical protein ENL09_01130 [Bacteroidetes bacterium]|nr:MAG: hypothetical protein DRI54_03475 [Bacteroidota bacterium]HHE64608.1 hypothetical protein [Bacteroidota bacterium]